MSVRLRMVEVVGDSHEALSPAHFLSRLFVLDTTEPPLSHLPTILIYWLTSGLDPDTVLRALGSDPQGGFVVR